MTNTYDTTGLPVGTSDPHALYNNASNMDDALHSLVAWWVDRFGKHRKTWSGFEADVLAFFQNNGYETPVNYAAGLSITRYGQTVVYLGELYAPLVAAIPFTTTNWTTDSSKFKAIGDASVRAALAAADGGKIIGYKARNVDARLSDRSSLDDQAGISGNGVTNDLSPLNAAIASARGKKLLLSDKTYLVSARPTNPYGVEFDGKGVIAQQVVVDGSTYLRQINTYSDKLKLHIGLEYCQRLWTRMRSDGQVKSFFYGDSTIQGGNGESYEYQLAQLIPAMMSGKGYPNFALTNRGIAGSRVSGWDTRYLADMSAATDLMVFKGAINDAGQPVETRLQTYRTDLESVFSQIRAPGNVYGTVKNLTLVLMGPNATNDLPNGRDPKFYEQLRGIHVEICHKYQVAFFDTYGMMPDADNGDGTWLDAPVPAVKVGVGIHPMDIGMSWIWGAMLDFICPDTAMTVFKKNHDINAGSSSAIILATTPATSFQFGRSLFPAELGNGWPLPGVVETVRNVDGSCIQRNWGYRNNECVVASRIWSVNGGFWSYFTGVEYDLAYVNGWSTFGSPLAKGTVVVDQSGMAHVEFAMKGGTVAANTVFANLPTGILPKYTVPVPVNKNTALGMIRYNTAGELKLETAGDATLMSGSFTFRVAPPI